MLDRVERQSPDVLFVTNRGPVEHSYDASGRLCSERGAGGVVSGLLCAAQGRRVTWISLAMNDADRAAAQRPNLDPGCPTALPDVASRLVDVPEEIYHQYYDGFSNRVLWFLQHDLAPDGALAADQMRAYWRDGYVKANEAVARAVTAELDARQGTGDTPPVVFHDYHLYLAPAMVRQRAPHANLQHFIHIPWPAPEVWARLPEDLARSIYAGLAANDVIGFQTKRDVRNFLLGARRYLRGAVRVGDATLRWQGREVRVAAYPIALTEEAVVAQARAPHAEAAARALFEQMGVEWGREQRDRRLILRVDRVDPTKNIVCGFEAYERLLDEHEELRGKVAFLALLVPSRESLPIYKRYAKQVQAAIDRVNQRFGTPNWQPITAIYGNDHARALACMRDYDVLVVNPLIDGMNLVVKEGAILNQRAGAIVLSTEAGAHAQLAQGVLSVTPCNVDATSDALWEALNLSDGQRKALAARTYGVVRRESAGAWLSSQLRDLSDVAASRERVEQDLSDDLTYRMPHPRIDRGIPAFGAIGAVEEFEGAPLLHFAPREGERDTIPLA